MTDYPTLMRRDMRPDWSGHRDAASVGGVPRFLWHDGPPLICVFSRILDGTLVALARDMTIKEVSVKTAVEMAGEWLREASTARLARRVERAVARAADGTAGAAAPPDPLDDETLAAPAASGRRGDLDVHAPEDTSLRRQTSKRSAVRMSSGIGGQRAFRRAHMD
jgi:hypothetical protein